MLLEGILVYRHRRTLTRIDWSADPWHALTGALKDTTGRKGKPLFLPLRRALTGRGHGPDMAALLPLIGRARALVRLEAASNSPPALAGGAGGGPSSPPPSAQK